MVVDVDGVRVCEVTGDASWARDLPLHLVATSIREFGYVWFTWSAVFSWTAEHSHAFDALKTALLSAHVLSPPNFESDFVLDTDASEVGLGAVLSQLDSRGVLRPVEFWSRRLTVKTRQSESTESKLLRQDE